MPAVESPLSAPGCHSVKTRPSAPNGNALPRIGFLYHWPLPTASPSCHRFHSARSGHPGRMQSNTHYLRGLRGCEFADRFPHCISGQSYLSCPDCFYHAILSPNHQACIRREVHRGYWVGVPFEDANLLTSVRIPRPSCLIVASCKHIVIGRREGHRRIDPSLVFFK
jgi:hypothetical protein